MKNAIRIYKALLKLYPRSYRNAFGAQMMQTFVDSYKDADSQGSAGMRFWLGTIADEFRNIAAQHTSSLTKGNGLLRVSIGKLVGAVVLLVPLYAIFCLLFINLSLAIPHPHVSGFGALFALVGVLLVLPGGSSLLVSYALASVFVNVLASVKQGLFRVA